MSDRQSNLETPYVNDKTLVCGSMVETEANPEETKKQPLEDPLVLEDPDLAKYLFEGDSDEEIEELACR